MISEPPHHSFGKPARALLQAALVAIFGFGVPGLAKAQTTARDVAVETVTRQDELAREAEIKRTQREARDLELKAVEARLLANTEARARIDAEIRDVRADRGRLNTALIDATGRSQVTEARVAALEERLNVLASSEQGIRRSLDARRGLIGDVLAALQRMGRRPPPAVLVRPEDVLEAVRASILMGAVIPELRGEVEALAADLAELVRLSRQAGIERAKVTEEFTALASERQRIAGLIEARRQRESEASVEAAREQRLSAEIGREATGLRELIERLQGEINSASRLAEEARRTQEAQSRETRDRMAQLAFRDPSRLSPQASFADLRGLLVQPVAGSQLRAFGTSPNVVGQTRGESYQTRPGAIVAAPADGWVAFSGPFLTFGHTVILQMGGGYHVLLAGLRRADVTRGQFVLAGEPLGVLGDTPEGTASVFGDGNGQPILYVEFHKDGRSIDPGPWWAKTQGDRFRG
ncbi:MAG: murein hydrolase activator EnvC family protein [Bosea sp. (in: a-proteobacteria)]